MNQKTMHCRRVIYSGRVQGVGFRYTTSGIARRFPVTGFVRNLADGTVELLAVGGKRDVDDFLSEVNRSMEDNIDSAATKTEVIDPPEEFSGFEIRP